MTTPANPLNPVPDNSLQAQIKALNDQLTSLQRQFASSGSAVGDYVWTSNFPSNWATANTVILYGNRLVPNGVALTKTDFPDLNTLYAAQGYPWGSTSTTFTIPDLLGRVPVSIGTHTDVSTLAKNDAQSLANRTPKHNTSGGSLSGSVSNGTLGGNVTAVASNGVNSAGGGGLVPNPPSSITVTITGAISNGSLSVGSIGPGGTRPTDMPAYASAGLFMLVALPG